MKQFLLVYRIFALNTIEASKFSQMRENNHILLCDNMKNLLAVKDVGNNKVDVIVVFLCLQKDGDCRFLDIFPAFVCTLIVLTLLSLLLFNGNSCTYKTISFLYSTRSLNRSRPLPRKSTWLAWKYQWPV